MSLINNFLLDDPTPCRLLNREEATRWWWNDYYWPTPWMFGLLMTFLFMAGCIGMGGLRIGCHVRLGSMLLKKTSACRRRATIESAGHRQRAAL
jgi:hypothetical protein